MIATEEEIISVDLNHLIVVQLSDNTIQPAVPDARVLFNISIVID